MISTPSASIFPFIDAIETAASKVFDPGASLIFLPTRPNIHTEYLDDRKRHPIRESLNYALVLLETGRPEALAQASTTIESVLAYQEAKDPDDQSYGLWHYFAEESVLEWPFPDYNWADFNALVLLLIWHRHAPRLSPALREAIQLSIQRAALCIRRRNVHLNYTNIAIKGTFVTLAAAELLNDADLLAYATDRMQKLHATIFASESFAEYNSPPYAAICLGALMAIDHYVGHEPGRQLALEIQHRFWNHISAHFHPATGEIAGPHSRSYSITLRESPGDLGSILHRASGGVIQYDFASAIADYPFTGLYGYLFEPRLPASALRHLLDKDRCAEVREVTQRYPEGSSADITSYLEPGFCLGSVNFQDGWEQRQNLIGFWPASEGVGVLKQEYLHDKRPCCSGFFASAQRGGRVLAASFLGNFADHHVSFRTEEIVADFLGSVVKFQSAGDPFEVYQNRTLLEKGSTTPIVEGDAIFLRLPKLALAIKALRHRTGPQDNNTATLSIQDGGFRLEFPHYQGEARHIRWADFPYAHTYFGLEITSPPSDLALWRDQFIKEKHAVTETEDDFRLRWGGLSVSVPNTTLTEEDIRTFFSRDRAIP